MRRMGQRDSRYRVELEPNVRVRMSEFPGWVSQRIMDEISSLAELADLAPIPVSSSIENLAPPLHLAVSDWVVTYLIERRERCIRVTGVEHT